MKNRSAAVLLATGAALAASVLLVLLLAAPRAAGVFLSHDRLAANGVAGARLEIVFETDPTPAALAALKVEARRGLVAVGPVEPDPDDVRRVVVALRALARPGRETLAVSWPGTAVERTLDLVGAAVDADGDGLPDAAELADEGERLRFRQWFCAIAESQYYGPWDGWIPEQRDCAGLVRFAWREALVAHDAAWRRRARFLVRAEMADVRSLRYPDLPFLGERLFRVKPKRVRGDGAWFERDDFAAFASARYLVQYNLLPLGKDLAAARPGDLLVYNQADLEHGDEDLPYHLMVWLGARPGAGPGPLLVYHTGDPKTGSVRRIAVADLARHPEPRWHPVAANEFFLGVYRLALLD